MNLSDIKKEAEWQVYHLSTHRKSKQLEMIHEYIDLTAAETIKAVLDCKPEEKVIPKKKAWICETCGNYNDPMGLGDDMCPCNGYNAALREWEENIRKLNL